MAWKLAAAARNAAASAIAALLDDGTIEVRTGAAPTNPSDADSGTLLAVHQLADPAAASVSAGTVTFDEIADDTSVNATGTAGHIRAKAAGGAVVLQASMATSGGDITVNSTAYVALGRAAFDALTITIPEAGA